jgi:hypothetical protein
MSDTSGRAPSPVREPTRRDPRSNPLRVLADVASEFTDLLTLPEDDELPSWYTDAFGPDVTGGTVIWWYQERWEEALPDAKALAVVAGLFGRAESTLDSATTVFREACDEPFRGDRSAAAEVLWAAAEALSELATLTDMVWERQLALRSAIRSARAPGDGGESGPVTTPAASVEPRCGRPPVPRAAEIAARAKELREDGEAWKDVVVVIRREFGTHVTAESLRKLCARYGADKTD